MSLSLLLEMATTAFGPRVALGSRDAGTTFEMLAARAAAGAGMIASRDPQHVIYVGRNGPCFPLLLMASATAGVPFVPLNYRLAREQLLELVGELERPLVLADPDYLPVVAGRYPTMSIGELLGTATAGARLAAQAVEDDTTAVILFTSGTSARPKAVLLTHANLLSYIFGTVELGGATADEAALVAVPPYHIAGVSSVLSNLYAGRRVVHLPDFEPNAWLRIVREQSVTSAMVVPTMLARIVDALDGRPADVPSLRLISYGGARLPRPVLERALAAFPAAGFCNAYGLTETSSTVALLGPDEHREAAASQVESIRERLSSVGQPVAGIEVQVRSAGGDVVPPGGSGQLWVRGAQVSGSYRGNQPVLQDGWFDTRDRAHVDSDGYLYIEGRGDDTIIRGGENIAPAEIEDVLLQHPAVKDVAVLGAPDDEWGERIVAVVVRHAKAAVDRDDLKQYVRSRLRGSRTPDEVVWRDTLPHTPTGKLLRRQLRDEIVEV